MRPEDQDDAQQSEEAAALGLDEWVRVALAGRGGSATLDDIAGALAGIEQLSAFVPTGEFSRFMADLDSAVKEKGIGNVNVRDAAGPRVHGVTLDEGGFLPCLFSDDSQAREYAVTEGFIEPADAAPFTCKSPESWFWDVLAEGHAGVVLDPGLDHELRIDRGGCARIFALLTLAGFAGKPELWVMFSEGHLAVLSSQEHGTMTAAVFSDERAAQWGADNSTFPECTTPSIATQAALEMVLGAGSTHLVVDSGFPTQLVYERRDVVRMIELLGGCVQQTAPPACNPGDPHSAVGTTPRPQPAPDQDQDQDQDDELNEAIRQATQYPSSPAVAPPGRSDAAAFAAFRDLRSGAADHTVAIWDYVDTLALDLDLYVPRHGARVDGLVWPSFFRHPDEEDQTIAYAFCREATALERNAASDMGDSVVHLSGIEAMRWAWAAPKPIHEIAVDRYQGSVGSVTFPTHWVLSAIWPHFHDIERLDDVAAVNLGKLGRSACARGTQPQVVRALLRGWQHLVCATGKDGTAALEHDGGRYLPIFSSAEAFFAFDQQNTDVLSPAPKLEAAPFGDWLGACGELDGVVLDPGGPWPLTLDATDLTILHRWETQNRRPHGTDLSMEVAERLHDGSMSERTAGRILADWPRYFIGLQRQPDGGVCVLTLPDRDCGALFSTHKRAELYLEVYRQAGVIDGSWEPIPMLARWQDSIFHSLAEQYEEGGWIDPCPPDAGLLVWANNFLGEQDFELDPTLVMDGHPGVHVHGNMLDAVLERLDEKLKPRVPDFVPADRRNAA